MICGVRAPELGMSNKYILIISEWLDSSPSKTVVVALFSILAFGISVANGVWIIAKERETVKITMSGWTNYSLYAQVSMEQLLGVFEGENRKNPLR